MSARSSSTLEDKLNRLQEIQQILQERKVSLDKSFALLEEAFKLKTEIENELSVMENKLIQLTKSAPEASSDLEV